LEPKELLFTLWRYRLWAGLVFVMTVLATVVSIWRMTPIYEASARLLIVQSDPTLRNLFSDRVGEQDASYARESNPINTYSELLKVRPLLEATIEALNLIDPRTQAKHTHESLISAIKVTPLKGTDLIKVSYQNRDPELAARLINELCQRFAMENVERSREEARGTLGFLDEQIIAVRKDLEENDRNLESFKSSRRTFDIPTELTNASNNLNRIEGYARDNHVAVNESGGRIRMLSLKLGFSPEQALADIALSTHPTIQRLRNQLIEAQTNSLLTSGLSDDHPQIKALRAQIKRLEEAIADEATLIEGKLIERLNLPVLDPLHEQLGRELVEEQISLLSGEVRQAALDAQLQAYHNHARELPQKEQILAKLTRDREFNTQLYQLLLKRREQARIAQAMQVGNVRIVHPASTPTSPVKPNKKQGIIGAVLMGMMLAVGTAMAIDAFDDSLRHGDRAREILRDIPITGQITERRHAVAGYLTRSIDDPLLSDPRFPPENHDAYALLRLNMVNALGPQLKLLLAGINQEEVSYYAANIAISFAKSGRRVLLIDGDLRTPSLHQFFELESPLGLRDMLSGEASWEDVASRVPGLPLWVIPSLQPEEHPLDLLDTPRLWALNQTLVNFDVVLGIAPGVKVVPDAVALAGLFNNFWLILHHKHDTRVDLRKGLELLAERGVPINGALFVRPAEPNA